MADLEVEAWEVGHMQSIQHFIWIEGWRNIRCANNR